MIDSKELRIGNLVLHNKEHYDLDSWHYKNNFVKVTSLTSGEYFHWEADTIDDLGGGKVISGQKYADTYPIQLIPEIFLCCGFRHQVEDDVSYYIQNELWFCHSGDYWYLETYKSFQFFHQLQNLYFALTGTELVFSDVLKMVK